MEKVLCGLLRDSRSDAFASPLGPGELRWMSLLATRDNEAVRIKGAVRPPGAGEGEALPSTPQEGSAPF